MASVSTIDIMNAHQQNNIMLVWLLNSNTEEANGNWCTIMTQLQKMVDIVQTCENPDEILDFITDTTCKKVYVILSETVSEETLCVLNDVPQLDTMFILSSNVVYMEKDLKKLYNKIKGVYKQVTDVLEVLKLSIQQADRDSISIGFAPSIDYKTISSLDQYSSTFLFTQIFKEILLTMEDDEESMKKSFIEYCRSLYSHNDDQLDMIELFKNSYHPEWSIWWYTREAFFYRTLNQALHTLEFSILIRMRFFIRDLHRQLEKLHAEQFSDGCEKSFVVYRGQGLSMQDFEKLKESQGNLVSFNNFLSTTKNREISLMYAENSLTKSHMIGILLKITIDLRIFTTPFATVDNEEEILFSMHSIFRIGNINKINDNERFYEVELKSVDNVDQSLRTLTNDIRRATNYPSVKGWERLGILLIKLGDLNRAEQLYEELLSQTKNEQKRGHLYQTLGMIKTGKKNHTEAISCYEKAIEIYKKMDSSNQFDSYICLMKIGEVYKKIEDFSKALSYYEKAHEILQKNLSEHHPDLANSYNNIGIIYDNMGDYTKALQYFEKACKIRQEISSADNHSLSILYKNMGAAYSKIGDYLRSLLYYDKVLEIKQKTFPVNPSDLAMAYNDISVAYSEIFDYERALSYCDRALEIEKKNLRPYDSIVISTFNNVGSIYTKMEEYRKAFLWLKKALDARKPDASTDDLFVAETYINMGEVHRSLKDFLNAISYYKKALKIRKKIVSPNSLLLATTYNKIGQTHAAMEHYAYALSYYELGFLIEEKVLSVNSPLLMETYNNIAEMYRLTGDHATALLYYKKKLEIEEKILSPKHPSLITTYGHVSQLEYSKGDYKLALDYLEKIREIQSNSLPSDHPAFISTYFTMATLLKSLNRDEEAIKWATQAVVIMSHNIHSDQLNMHKHQGDLSTYLASIVPVDMMKTIIKSQWTYPTILILSSSQKCRLYSVFKDLTNEHLMTPISAHDCKTTLQLSETIKHVVMEVSSISERTRDYLLNIISSMDHIESIYLLSASPKTREERKKFFDQFSKVCIFCEDEGQLALRWAMDTAEEYRTIGDQFIKEGKKDIAREYFDRGMQLFNRLEKFIKSVKQK